MARVFSATPKNFQEISEGTRIGGGLTFKPAPYLPIVGYNEFDRLAVTMKGGTIVALDQYGFLVPANGGASTVKFTYSSLDVDHGVYDFDSFTGSASDTKVVAAKTTTNSMDANVPIGILPSDVYQWDMDVDPNYKVQKSIALLEDWLILVPLTSDLITAHGVGSELGKYHSGAYVMPDENSKFVPFVPTTETVTATGSAYQIINYDQNVGRIIKIEDVAADPDFTGGYENVSNVPGLGLSGKENDGLPHGIDSTTKKGIFVQLLF